MMDPQISDADLELLNQGPMDPAGKYEAVVQAKLRKAAPHAVQSIIDIAMNSENDGMRLKAAIYITDRVLGKIPDANPAGTQAANWENIIAGTFVEPSHEARSGGRSIEGR
jgi:hypothetical protein